ncbi:hypothetical protein [Tunturibacter empetritectus]|uniref:Uncharacterized protein n=1 Tax=Tunturiibacter empetritectus TaxID=3069691 RepID=A0A7W8IHW0_9BACT|nr:hypothetical protein [Edaphobacter lichenicola]MBB5317446.1 hypothetical protein [Edaphobacter lichenicola]
MLFEPTKSKRNVVLALQIVRTASRKSAPSIADSPRISRIAALFCDHERITERLFDDRDEAVLLLRFWQAIRPSDRIFCADVVKRLALVRKRSWRLGVLPSIEIDIRQVYKPELYDTQKMWSENSTAVDRKIGAEYNQHPS